MDVFMAVTAFASGLASGLLFRLPEPACEREALTLASASCLSASLSAAATAVLVGGL